LARLKWSILLKLVRLPLQYAPPIDYNSHPLDQVLQAVVTHLAVQYSLNLILFLTVNDSWGWGWCRSSARDGISKHGGQLDHGEDGVEAVEVAGKREVVCAMADTGFDNKGA
jgi:hypothetical protein